MLKKIFEKKVKTSLRINQSRSVSVQTRRTEAEEKVFVCPEPIRTLPPEGVPDVDGENLGDPLYSEYVMETFQYYKNREAKFMVGDYIGQQKEITEAMRAALVDWLVDVHQYFQLNPEALYTAVKMTDLFLSKKQVRKEHLQLVVAAALLVASKLDELNPRNLEINRVDELVGVSPGAFTRDTLMKVERKMLNVLKFDLGFSLSYTYLRRLQIHPGVLQWPQAFRVGGDLQQFDCHVEKTSYS